MTHRVAVLLMAASSGGCASYEPEIRKPEMRTFVFEQEAATRTNAPQFETDVILPAGTQAWQLSVGCRDHGRTCRRASVTLGLQFAGPTMPDVRITLSPEGEPAPSPQHSTCFEDYVSDAPEHARCTVFVHHGWEVDIARTQDDGRRRQFVARVENAGPPIAAHVSISVIDPLE